MEHSERRSRAIFARSATASPHPRISNRQFLVRLENAATPRKQTPEVNPNRHFSEGGRPDVTLWFAHFPPANGEEGSFHTLRSFGMTTKTDRRRGRARIAPAPPSVVPSRQPALGRHPEELGDEGSLPICALTQLG
jgi:hypothetical protein